MIDVQPYIDKLELLKEYMGECISRNETIEVWVDLMVCPIIYYIANGLPIPNPHKKNIKLKIISFNEWLETSTQSTLHLKSIEA